MITRTELQRISQYHDPAGHILSLYLPLTVDRTDDDHTIVAKNLLRDAGARFQRSYGVPLPDPVHDMFEDVRVFLRDDVSHYGRAVALFARPNDGILEAYSVPRKVEPAATVAQRAEIAQMIRFVEDYQPLCACLISRDHARILTGQFDNLEQHALLETPDVPGKHEQGGWSQARYQRHIEDHVHRHFKNIANELFGMLETDPYTYLILGGPEEVVAAFREELHPYVRARVIGEIRVLMEANINEIREQVIDVVERSIRESKRRLLESVRAEALAHDRGVKGLDASLSALQHGQLLSMIIDRNLHSTGIACLDCGTMSLNAGPGNACSYCSGRLRELDDVAPALITSAFEQGADVAVVEDYDLREDLAQLGGVGALLRYRVEQQSA